MPMKRKVINGQGVNGDLGVCSECTYAHDPFSPGLDGKPTLARCPFFQYAVLWRRPCIIGHFKSKKQ